MVRRALSTLLAIGFTGCIATLDYDDYADSVGSDAAAGSSGSAGSAGSSGAGGSSGAAGAGASGGAGGAGASGGASGAGASGGAGGSSGNGGAGGSGGTPDCADDPAACNDNDPCTVDQCQEGICQHPPKCQAACCNGTCAGCCTDADCEDGVPCTVNQCVAGSCVTIPNDGACEFPFRCDTTFNCALIGYSCTVGPEACPDSYACTTDECLGGFCRNSFACGNGQKCCGISAGCGSC
jgi:hypothetical protein